MPNSILEEMPEDARAQARVQVFRGHSGQKRPYSIPFTYSIIAEGYGVWMAWINFDQLYVENDYHGPQLLARYCSDLRLTAQGQWSNGDTHHDNPTWAAVIALCHPQGDIWMRQPPADMNSRRAEFTRKTLAELAGENPSEFFAYEIQTVTGANSRRSDMRSEFRIISRPEAPHRWMFWTHAPVRISHDPYELNHWFTRHVAQLRGARRPQWTPVQRKRWLDHVHREITGKTAPELKFDDLAASPDEKPDIGLMLGQENAAGRVRRWVIPRAAFADAKWAGEKLHLSFAGVEDAFSKNVTLLFHSVSAGRTVIREILNGERRRLGISDHLRGIIGIPEDDDYMLLIGLSESEENEHAALYRERHGPDIKQSRSGLLLQLFAPYDHKNKS